jgi:hypothetical protein
MNACLSVCGLTFLAIPARHPADDPGGAVPVQPPTVRGDEQRPFGALADGQVDSAGGARRKRGGHHLAALG